MKGLFLNESHAFLLGGWLAGRLVGWLAGLLAGRVAGWLFGWLVGRLVGWYLTRPLRARPPKSILQYEV